MKLLHLVEERDRENGSNFCSIYAWIASLVAVAAILFAGARVLEARALRAENQKLREAFAVAYERAKWSCDLNEGERIICAVKDGALSRLALDQTDHLVSGKGIASPLGKTPSKKRRPK